MDLDALKEANFFSFMNSKIRLTISTSMTSMGLDSVNTKFYSFISYFILFKERLLEKHHSIIVFVELKMFRQEDNKEQDVSITDSSIAKDIFFNV